MHYQFIFEQFLDGLECFSSFQIANASYELGCYILVVTHADFDGCKDA